ncbi:hypothetical protein MBEHAL_1354 [Halarchaeum acidiphilum MH1-52-1]|uniref:Outer membrane lipoprotein-sorting protein n=1 Tax=Halarchaeum acidiphilum MH1-52-1 TaxID=1261545 RepID=U3A4M6_9EURY|nr:hypothetical protein [Halarchaeum acidiphilum]GAD52594.1 hypothetical protein MBEHAL_1354 [Halarchaeum acidiphilum MH1-52-1]
MPRHRRRRCALCLGLVGVLLLAGCSTLSSTGISDADAVGEQVQHRYDAIDRYSATVTKTVETPNGETSVSARLSADTDGAATVTYESGPRAGTTRTYASAARSPVLATGPDGAPARGATYGALAASLVRTNDVSIDGTTVLDGHRSVVVSLVPDGDGNASAADGLERRVWVDVERRIPLRVETTWTTATGANVTETVRYANVTLDEANATETTTANGVGAA